MTGKRCGFRLLMLTLVVLSAGALSIGCSDETRLSDQPTAQEVVTAAIDWVEQADCQAVASSAPVAKQAWVWRFQQGGRVAVGVNGAIVIDGDNLYLKIDEEVDFEAPTAPLMWLRLSPEDFPNTTSIEEAQPVFRNWTEILMTNPLLCMREMTPESTVKDSADGTAWVVTGNVREIDVLGTFLTPAGAAHATEIGYLPPLVAAVTLIVEKDSGTPLETDIAFSSGDPNPNTVFVWHWLEGVWVPPETSTVGLDQYLKTTTE